MRSILRLASNAALCAVALGCSAEAPEQDSEGHGSVFAFELTAADLASLPACTSALAGTVAYVTGSSTLVTCSSGKWTSIACTAARAGDVAYSSTTKTLLACIAKKWTPVSMPTSPNSLVSTKVEPAGPNCPSGGSRIDVGVDTNHDGVLQASEIQSTAYACNGASAPTAAPTGPAPAPFTVSQPWSYDVTAGRPTSNSADVISALATATASAGLRVDFSTTVLRADSTTPLVAWTPDSAYVSPDCDAPGSAAMPLPASGALEGETGYACLGGGDCKLLVVDPVRRKLFEMFHASYDGTKLTTSCFVAWDLDKTYSLPVRGENCTSASVTGLPAAALTYSADEVAAGEIKHAIGVVLPRTAILKNAYGRLASHGTFGGTATTGVPMGALLRLSPDYPVASLPTAGARVVAKALQRYGMIVADSGMFTLTAQDDRFTTAKWGTSLSARDLDAVHITDFEVIDTGPTVQPAQGCFRK